VPTSTPQAEAPERRHVILFVDDQAGTLRAFEGPLQDEHPGWEMIFVPSFDDALAVLGARPVDVLLAEVQGAGDADGLRRLGDVRRGHPGVTRIVVSPPGDRDAVAHLAGVAHQSLARPLDLAAVGEALSRACAVRELIGRQAVRAALGGAAAALPAVPPIFLELQAALRDPRAESRPIARIVVRDRRLAAKLLQLVSSSFFGFSANSAGSAVTNVEQAVKLLGIGTAHYLALAAAIFAAHDAAADHYGFSLSLLQRHSLLAARIAARLLPSREASEQAFVSALLHDAGKLLLASRSPDAYRRLVARAAQEGQPLAALEAAELGATHAEAGACLFGVWGLPTVVVEAVAFHHGPSRAGRSAFDVSGAVHVAQVLAHEVTAPAGYDDVEGPRRAPAFDEAYLDAAGVAARVPAWRAMAARLTGEESSR
jgi:HD-like signal output (HDOD) protein